MSNRDRFLACCISLAAAATPFIATAEEHRCDGHCKDTKECHCKHCECEPGKECSCDKSCKGDACEEHHKE